MEGKRFFVLVALVAAVMLPMAAAASKPGPTVAEVALYKGADRQRMLEEGARREGRLTFYTTGILVQTVRPLVDAFQKKYPYLKVDIWRASTTELIPRFAQEFKVGKHTADVIELTQTGGVMLQEAALLQPFYSPNLADIEEGSVNKAPEGGAFRAAHYQSGISLGYNTKLIKKDEVPKTYQDLLKPQWKGKMAMAGSNTGVSWAGALLENQGEDFVEKMAKQEIAIHTVSARALLDMIINGEYALSPTITDSHVNKSQQIGAPVAWVPLEPVPAYIGQIMLPKDSPHPYVAMLFIDFDLSRQGGDLYVANGYDSPRKDIPGGLAYKRYYGPFSTKQEKTWNETFNRLFLKR